MKLLYRVRVQALTGKLVVQKREFGPSDLIPQTEGIYPWIDCTAADIDDIDLKQSREWVLVKALA